MSPTNVQKSKRILFAVLNWGLGHASRSQQIINELIARGHELHIASDGPPLEMLQKEYPQLISHELPSYNVHYKHGHILLNVAQQSLKIINSIRAEQKTIKRLQAQYKYDLIISDHRYGCYSKSCRSIFITHQVNMLTGTRLTNTTANFVNRNLIRLFDLCWIADDNNSRYAGVLSQVQSFAVPYRYIGILSTKEYMLQEKKYDYMIVLSGPEPKRTDFEHVILEQAKRIDKKGLLVRGLPSTSEPIVSESLDSFNYLNDKQISNMAARSELYIGRSGYSTIMDLARLRKCAVLIPTPGQTEQMYLAKHLKDDPQFAMISEDEFQLSYAIETGKKLIVPPSKGSDDLLKQAIDEMEKQH